MPLVGPPAPFALSSNHLFPMCLWSGLRLPLFYLRTICFPAWVPLVGSPAPSILFSNYLFLDLGTSGRVSGCLYFIFELFVSQPGCLCRASGCLCFIFELLMSPSLGASGRVPLVPLVGSPAPFVFSSNNLFSNLGASGRVSGCLCFIFEAFVSQPECLWSGLRLPLLYSPNNLLMGCSILS